MNFEVSIVISTLNALLLTLLGILIGGSLLPLSSSPHWFVRAWDFPRVQIVVLAWMAAIAFAAVNWVARQPSKIAVGWIAATAIVITAWHLFRIMPYTPLTVTQAKGWDGNVDAASDPDANRLRELVTNVRQENDAFTEWGKVVRDADADVVIIAEVDGRWAAAIQQLRSLYPHQFIHPQDNWYGLALISRLPVTEHAIRFLVQDDVPSIDATIELHSGSEVRMVGVHPRPPEPIRDNDAVARDAELVLWGEDLADEKRPVVIGGDLNDVAWSQSTRLFLRLSQLLDPRRGRGLYNSFHADRFWMRFPLDHVFHSSHFTIRDMRRLPHVGSDHFPILIDLQLRPESDALHSPLAEKMDDNQEADERIDRAKRAHDLDVESVDEADRESFAP